ncbi:MAG: class I SAM-dependent methyltransferase [Gammaproteobacteria bacterium]|nr:class I SAM-dependent methyltransferase [Gammaproteobacteria bacterium]MBU1980624.1 class I SAM-dependent methyltransferase [Gammaproteobacteria bacterium]
MNIDPLAEFKIKQRETWTLGNFGDMAVFTTPVAGHLVRYAGVTSGQTVLDVGTGTGVVAITARIKGARVTGLDLTPALLAQAKESAMIAGHDDIAWHEGDAEALPFPDASFDVVLSQFGHMFAPRHDVAVSEMLRVLKPGGMIAFATWPGEQLIGRMFSLNAKYVPPPPGIVSPVQWGDVAIVRQRMGESVKRMHAERGIMGIPALSPRHLRLFLEAKTGPFIRTVQALQNDPASLEAWRSEMEELMHEYLHDNVVRHEYLLIRAIKV